MPDAVQEEPVVVVVGATGVIGAAVVRLLGAGRASSVCPAAPTRRSTSPTPRASTPPWRPWGSSTPWCAPAPTARSPRPRTCPPRCTGRRCGPSWSARCTSSTPPCGTCARGVDHAHDRPVRPDRPWGRRRRLDRRRPGDLPRRGRPRAAARGAGRRRQPRPGRGDAPGGGSARGRRDGGVRGRPPLPPGGRGTVERLGDHLTIRPTAGRPAAGPPARPPCAAAARAARR